MYGTVAHLKLKPGGYDKIRALFQEAGETLDPGEVAAYILRPDGDEEGVIIVGVFESKEAYVANANRPETHARYLKIRENLAAEPEWHDGTIEQHLA